MKKRKRLKRRWCKHCHVDAARFGVLCAYCYRRGITPPPTPNGRRKFLDHEWVHDGKAVYALYMQSNEWKRKRAKKIRSVGARCQNHICRSPVNLEVHHLNYKRLGREKMSDLQVLCKLCHMEAHDNLPFPARFYRAETSQSIQA